MTGNLANLLQPEQNVMSIDISEEALMTALKKNKAIQTKKFDANKRLPFNNNSFDCIISTHLLYFLKDKENIINEYYRVLKSNGILILTEFDGYKNITETLNIATNKKGILLWKISDILLNFLNTIPKERYLTLDDLISLFDRHKFQIDKHYKTFGNLSNTLLIQKKEIDCNE